MKIATIARYAYKSALSGRLRTFLTFLAVAIGAFSISLLTGLSNGIRVDVEESATSLGSELIFVAPTTVSENVFLASQRQSFITFKEQFTTSDVKKVRSIPGIKVAVGGVSLLMEVNKSGEVKGINIVGVEKGYEDIIPTIKVAEGRWFKSRQEVVVGADVATDFFSKRISVGEKLYIDGQRFRVAGILEKTGNSLARIDDRILMDADAFKNLPSNTFAKDEFAVIIARAVKGVDVEAVASQVKDVLKRTRPGDKDTFSVITPKFIRQQVGEITGLLQLFFIVVAGMSLLVGLVGVSNTVYMNVIDRTREIALLRTLGTLKKEIVLIFVLEGAMLSFTGALAGLVVGILIGFIQPFISFLPDMLIIAASLVAISLLGAIASIFPARRGAEIEPALAMRYE